MGKLTFRGGIHPYEGKELSKDHPIEKYLTKDERSPWLFNFHDRLATSDSFCANVNTGIKQIWEKVEPGYRASLYAFRHSWATIAQNECGATMNDVDFGLNHSINRMAKVYVKIDFTPA